MKDSWIKVDGSKNVPIGKWLVTVDEYKRKGREVHVCERHENVTYIGGHFDFDMPEVIAYMACPEAYEP